MWNSRVRFKHLLTKDETHEAVQASMNAIATVIEGNTAFLSLNSVLIEKMRNIPQGDDFFGPVDYANKLLDSVYDFADANRIWID